jgi:hypothetical protein
VEGILERYLSIFLPFIATVVLAHLVVRSSGSWQVERLGLASSDLLRRILVASGSAIGIIVGVDLVTGGDLLLRPDPLRSPILVGLVVVGLVAANFAWRAFGLVGERLRR